MSRWNTVESASKVDITSSESLIQFGPSYRLGIAISDPLPEFGKFTIDIRLRYSNFGVRFFGTTDLRALEILWRILNGSENTTFFVLWEPSVVRIKKFRGFVVLEKEAYS